MICCLNVLSLLADDGREEKDKVTNSSPCWVVGEEVVGDEVDGEEEEEEGEREVGADE
jgi:hypothetical protein